MSRDTHKNHERGRPSIDPDSKADPGETDRTEKGERSSEGQTSPSYAVSYTHLIGYDSATKTVLLGEQGLPAAEKHWKRTVDGTSFTYTSQRCVEETGL